MDQSESANESRRSRAPAAPESGSRSFLIAVRRAAGWRVSPREVDAALEALALTDEDPTPRQVAEIAAATRGERSQRQRRNSDLWRTLGTHLAAQSRPGDPEAQRAFIGETRLVAGHRLSDPFLLNVAIAIAEAGYRLDSEFVGQVARWFNRRRQATTDWNELITEINDAIQAVERSRAEAIAAQRRRASIEGQRARQAALGVPQKRVMLRKRRSKPLRRK